MYSTALHQLLPKYLSICILFALIIDSNCPAKESVFTDCAMYTDCAYQRRKNTVISLYRHINYSAYFLIDYASKAVCSSPIYCFLSNNVENRRVHE